VSRKSITTGTRVVLPVIVSDKFKIDAAIRLASNGTFIAYSTQPDTIADDGTDRNSPFVKAQLDHIATPGSTSARSSSMCGAMWSTGQVAPYLRDIGFARCFAFRKAAPVSPAAAAAPPSFDLRSASEFAETDKHHWSDR
jgi:hypothetical protein